ADLLCEWAQLDGVDSPEQVIGDCKKVHCAAGVEMDVTDDSDVPDDHEDCTIDSCDTKGPSHVPKQDGTPCDDKTGSKGVCKNGVCAVQCSSTIACPDPGPCATVACDAAVGTCIVTPLSDGTPPPGVTQKAGDCNVNVCVGGVATDVPDDSDVPVTATDCDTE